MPQAKDDGEHLSLATAAAVVYHQIMGTASQTASPEDLIELLDRVASAIANVAPIYTSDRAAGTPRQLAPIELIHCRFEGGATVVKTSFGLEYRNLTIRRGDMRSAITILKGARIDFRRRP